MHLLCHWILENLSENQMEELTLDEKEGSWFTITPVLHEADKIEQKLTNDGQDFNSSALSLNSRKSLNPNWRNWRLAKKIWSTITPFFAKPIKLNKSSLKMDKILLYLLCHWILENLSEYQLEELTPDEKEEIWSTITSILHEANKIKQKLTKDGQDFTLSTLSLNSRKSIWIPVGRIDVWRKRRKLVNHNTRSSWSQ